MNLTLQPLTQEGFSPFGDVIEPDKSKAVQINDGNCVRYDDLGRIQVSPPGNATLSIFRARPCELPYKLTCLERHPLGSQAFLPVGLRPFCVVVARGDDKPDLDSISAFITLPCQGVNIGRDVWHHPLIALEKESVFWVADWVGEEENLEIYPLSAEIVIDA